MAELTPMMKQYQEIKKAYPDAILFYRLGDFYEMFDDDARLASRELDLTLTSRDRGKKAKPAEEQIPMCGVPYHASDSYIAKLVSKGYKVAVCEQMESPSAAKGLVRRDIIRIVTPGTIMDAAGLDDTKGNFLCGIYLAPLPDTPAHTSNTPVNTSNTAVNASDGADSDADKENPLSDHAVSVPDSTHVLSADAPCPMITAGVAFCDISTGEVHVTGFSGPDRVEHLINELGRFSPSEAVLSQTAAADPLLMRTLSEKFTCLTEISHDDARFSPDAAENAVIRQFGTDTAARLRDKFPVLLALGGLLQYLYETQKTDLSHINRLDDYEQGVFMELDLSARRNLELTRTLRSQERRGSLLWVLDRTKTPMGARCLRGWLEKPLLSVAKIRRRSHAVSAMTENLIVREELINVLTGFGDMERLMGRMVYGTAGGRDMNAFRAAAERLPEVKRRLSEFEDRTLRRMAENLDTLDDLAADIAAVIDDDPPFSVREGGFIRTGFHPEVDRLRGILHGGRGIIAEMEAREKEVTGIRTLKIGYNKVFGYYIEVSNSFRDQVPERYIRKQTLVNGERYITEELKELENSVLTASDRVAELEYQLFRELRERVTKAAPRVAKTAAAVAQADALASLATVAVANRYCCPEVDESGVIEIHEGRHPVVERMRRDEPFVPNDTFMGEREQRVAIITGPNMAGKSTYMRQVALIVLMAQIGSFVPASSARIGIADRIFTRIGASDDLAAGQSTFMVEMTEVAHILRAATSRSLLILDEIGRGTSTYDGMSIARAVLEHCAKKKRAKTLFATHYHELTRLEQLLPGTVNYNVAVRTRGEDIVFLRKIIPGGADRSYGIEVARLAGLPNPVIRRAKEILRELESGTVNTRTLSGKTAPPSGESASGTQTEQMGHNAAASEHGAQSGHGAQFPNAVRPGTRAANGTRTGTQAANGTRTDTRAANGTRTGTVDGAPFDAAGQISFTAVAEREVLDALRRCQPDTLTPIEAIGILYEWKKKIQ